MYKKLQIIFFLVFCSSSMVAKSNIDYNLRLISENDHEIIVEFELFNYQSYEIKINGNTYTKLSFKGGYPELKLGFPEIYRIGKSFIIPEESDPKIEILESSFEEIENTIIIPSKGKILRNTNPENIDYVFGKAYQKDQFYPASLAEFSKSYTLRELDGRVLYFYPIQQNPVSKKVRIYKKIKLRVLKNTNDKIVKPSVFFNEIYANHFLNFNTAKYTPLEENGSLLIITHPDFEQLLEPFILWKKQRGLDVEMVTTNTSGTSATEIKNYILEKYSQSNLNFILLVGDYNYVTPFYVNNNACDPVYGHMEGNDSYAEVIVGRFSGTTIEEINTQIERTIHYEKYLNTSDDWLSKYLLIGSKEGPGDDNEYDYEHLRNIKYDLLNYTYSGGDEMYDGSQGEEDLAGNPTEFMVRDTLNSGRGILNYTGHGFTDKILTSGFSNDQVNQLQNINRLPFVTFVGCITGNFAGQTCLAEALLHATYNNVPTGAIAAFASTIDQTWNPPMAAQDEMMDILIESYETNSKRTFGGLVVNGCLFMNDQYGNDGAEMTDTWTIFGDPTLMIRTKTPDKIDLWYNHILTIGNENFSIQNIDKKYAITLTQNDSVIASIITNQENVELTFSTISSLNDIILTITGFNCETLIDTIKVLPNTDPFVVLDKYYIKTDDNKIDYGDELNFDFYIKNIGLANINNLYAKLYSESGAIQIITDSFSIGNLAGEERKVFENQLKIQINAVVADQEEVKLDLEISDGTLSWLSSFKFNINAPKFKFISTTIIDSLAGNNNGRFDPGELITTEIKVANIGHSTSPPLEIDIQGNEKANLIENQLTIPALNAFDTTTFNIPVYCSSYTNSGDDVNIEILANANGYKQNDTICFPIGTLIDDFETGTFSKFDWEVGSIYQWKIYDTINFTAEDTISPYDGRYAIRSADISHNSKSEFSINLDVVADDEIRFYIRVSCEYQPYIYYDYLEFLIDNVSQRKWDGEIQWKKVSFPVSKGEHTFTWRYKKDGALSAGEDAAWIDRITLPSHESTIAPEIQFSISSDPITSVRTNELYTYELEFNSFSENFIESEVNIIAYNLPSWLELSKNGDNWNISGIAEVPYGTKEQLYLFAKFEQYFANQSFELKVDPPLMVESVLQKKYNIYPNPFQQEIYIEGKTYQHLKTYNYIGKEAQTNISENKIIIEGDNGIYIIEIFDGEQYHYFKIVKSH